ncbi:MAG TPA: hypothetical protein VFZ26_16300 [Gemmatimonadales bacterium]
MSYSLPRLVVVGLLGAAACSSQDGPSGPGSATPSRAFGIWQPGSHDTCTQEQHDAYAVVGPDGKAYPTWHPPTGPGGCSFGHEHGRDPRGSDLYEAGEGVAFGYANEVLALADPANPRDEDHVGHKIEWENDLALPVAEGGAPAVCDVLFKLHQGTHSRDALTNNLHELVYRLRCEDGAELRITMLAAIGYPGQFARACTQTNYVNVGPPTPANSPIGYGARYIPDRTCVEQHMLVAPGANSNYGSALNESWNTFIAVDRADGNVLAFFNPWFQVELPSRFHDPAHPSALGRPIDVCYEELEAGRRASGGACAASTGDGAIRDVPFDDPRSVFKGVARSIELNVTRITNAAGPAVWYTDAFGHRASREPFPGSIRQRIASVNRELGLDFVGPSIGRGREYDGAGVRAPN